MYSLATLRLAFHHSLPNLGWVSFNSFNYPFFDLVVGLNSPSNLLPLESRVTLLTMKHAALGFAHSYLFRAKDAHRKWRTVCGDHCVFDGSIMGGNA